MSVDRNEKRAQEIRERFGLRSDLVHVEAVRRSRRGVESALLGIPLTDEEEADIASRDVLTEWVASVNDAGVDETHYGGCWIDQAAGGVLHVGVTGDDPVKVFTRLTSALPEGHGSVLTQVAHSLRELRGVQRSITDLFLSSETLRRVLVEVAIRVDKNVVVLTVRPEPIPVEMTTYLSSLGVVTMRTATDGYRVENDSTTRGEH